jgi:2-C-methyl-D-erythritol 4-phosphate cytidylyltransferase
MTDVAVIILTAPPMPGEAPGAMIKVDGRESVLRCMEMFTNRDGIVQTMVVIDAKHADEIKRKLGSHLMFMGIKLVTSGDSWWTQLADAKKALSDDARHILVHDGARPAVPYTDLDALLALAGKKDTVALATSVPGMLLKSSKLPGTGWNSDQPVASMQTPVLFSRPAFDEAVRENRFPTPIELIAGSFLNQRLGTVDTSIVKAMIGLLPKPKVKAPSSPFEEAQW